MYGVHACPESWHRDQGGGAWLLLYLGPCLEFLASEVDNRLDFVAVDKVCDIRISDIGCGP